MKRTALIFLVAPAALALAVSAAQATGSANRTFVSGKGANIGACTRVSPCKTFAYALTQTASGGEIDVLDPADYGRVTITQAVSIVNDGIGEAGVLASSAGDGIAIEAGPADAVYLRGLTIQGTATPTSGIAFYSGLSLEVVDCDIHGFSQLLNGSGIRIIPTTTSTFLIARTNVSNNALYGVFVAPRASAVVGGVIRASTLNNNSQGMTVVDGKLTAAVPLNVDVVDSVISNNSGYGVRSSNNATTVTTITNSYVTGNKNGVYVSGVSPGPIFRISGSTISDNVAGYAIHAGTVYTYGDNLIEGNGGNTGSLAPVALQ